MNTSSWKNATPESILFWAIAKTKIAWNTITPVHYQGALAASEYLTYNAAKLYIALNLRIGAVGIEDVFQYINFYNEANAVCFISTNAVPVWNVTTAAFNYLTQSRDVNNIYFSRLGVNGSPPYIKFIGYKLTTV